MAENFCGFHGFSCYCKSFIPIFLRELQKFLVTKVSWYRATVNCNFMIYINTSKDNPPEPLTLSLYIKLPKTFLLSNTLFIAVTIHYRINKPLKVNKITTQSLLRCTLVYTHVLCRHVCIV